MEVKRTRKKKYNTENERVEAMRASKRKWAQEHRLEKKQIAESETTSFAERYRKDLVESIYPLDFDYRVTLTCERQVSVEAIRKYANVFFRYLLSEGAITNFFYAIEHGSFGDHIHVEAVVQTSGYCPTRIKNLIFKSWGRGFIKCRKLYNEVEKWKGIDYVAKHINVSSRSHRIQKLADNWEVHRFHNAAAPANVIVEAHEPEVATSVEAGDGTGILNGVETEPINLIDIFLMVSEGIISLFLPTYTFRITRKIGLRMSHWVANLILLALCFRE